ncbi:MAG: hypothetical protein EHM24_33900, partial [Acidobacteria bacterium]
MMFDDNPFKGLIPGGGGSVALPPAQRPASQPTPETPGEARSSALADEKKRQDIEEAERKAERERRLGPSDTEKQDLAAGFLGRMMNADALYGTGVMPRGPEFQSMREVTPTNLSKAYQYTPEERAAKNYIDDWIRAKLRLESGAVIGDEEMDREYKLYFPMPGDTAEDLARKKEQRLQAHNAMKILAGPSVEDTAVRGGKDIHGNEVLPIPSGSPVITEPDFPQAGGAPLDLSGLGGEQRPFTQGNLLNTTSDKPEEPPLFDLVGGSVGKPPPPPPPPPPTPLELGAGNVVEGVGNLAGLVANPVTAGVNWLAGSDVMGKPDLGANLREGLGLPSDDSALGGVLEAGAGALGMAGAANALARVPSVIASPMQSAVANVLAKEPIRQATSAMAGAGSGEAARALGAPVPVQIAANVLGSVAGYGKAPPVSPRGMDPALAAASRAESVPISRPMFDPRKRVRAGDLESSYGSSERIRGG